MSTLAPNYEAPNVASHEPRPIASVMTDVLARYGLRELSQRSDSVAAFRSNHSIRPDRKLAVA